MYYWKSSGSIIYPAFQAMSSNRLTVHHLDPWRHEISVRTDRMRVREGVGRTRLLTELDAARATGEAGAGAGARDYAPLPGDEAVNATSAQPELPFPVVLEMAEAVVRHCTSLPAGGVLGSAFKAAFRAFHGRELQLKFIGQRVQIKDILERSKVVERVVRNTQPLYRYRGPVAAPGHAPVPAPVPV